MSKKTIRFMCDSHRAMFSYAPIDKLDNYWNIWIEQGYSYYLEDDIHRALLWFGNAWDIKQLVLKRVVPSQQAVNKFTINAILVTH